MNVLVAESVGFSELALETLKPLGTIRREDLSGAALQDAVSECDVLWVRLRNYIGPDVLAAAPRLRWIVTPTTGLNHLDLEAAEARGIRILSLKGEVDFLKNIRATAELTIGLMLTLLRHLPEAARGVRDGVWNRDLFRGRELFERPVGLVGFGRLGRIVAGYLLAFGSRVRACDPAQPGNDMPGVERVSLEELLRHSSIVSIHASYDRAGAKMFNADCFKQMPPGAWLVNTARGELIDEKALLHALESGHLGGAALDVLTAEPSMDVRAHPLVEFARRSDRLIITPHIGGCTKESMERAEAFMARRLVEALARTTS